MFRTLIIEDSMVFRRSLHDLLSAHFPAVQVTESGSGEDAMAIMQTSMPDLILLDIRLPGMNGLELTRQVKMADPDVVIIILTSYDLPEYREVALQHRADYFLPKTTPTSQLLRAVESVIEFSPDGEPHPRP
jgi:DNA-binding NarL/FixJ family response regulator